MVAHGSLDPQAEGADLSRLDSIRIAPAAGMAVASRGVNVGHATGRDHCRLEGSDERTHEEASR